MSDLEARIEELWENRDTLDVADPDVASTIREAVAMLDLGEARVAEVLPNGTTMGDVVVYQWLKHAILLLFKVAQMETLELGPFEYADKIPLKSGYEAAGVRVVPGASARWGSFLDKGVILMPSYVNIGARVGAGSMVDTWATVGSCAQIGTNVHLSGGVGIGGVLEPPQAEPVVIDDEAFIGSRSMVTEGARVGRGAMLGAGVILNPSIPVIDANTGLEVSRGVVPPWCLVINATRPKEFDGGTFGMPCALIIKHFAEGERHDKAALNAVLREHGVAV
ncbi:MAG: 2,3,4,5-tetrahydropyridine-2,6-dicarboxylate N-succinyltransferase [Acidimicrobiia bacterium]|nr:2,3,4,5-tetrahydropyridine-2,6-dicarboxylate N-succinyltransferase [Acidimicrobiia bacterium]